MSMLDYNPTGPLPQRRRGRRRRRRGCPLLAAFAACALTLLVLVAAGCTIDEQYGADGGWGTALQVDTGNVTSDADESTAPWLFTTEHEIEERAILRFEDVVAAQAIEFDDEQLRLLDEGEALVGVVDVTMPVRHGDGLTESPAGLLDSVDAYVRQLGLGEPEQSLRRFEAMVEAGYYDPDDAVHQTLKRRYLAFQREAGGDDDLPVAFGKQAAALEANECMTCLVSCKLDVGRRDKPFDTPDDRADPGKNNPGTRAGRRSRSCHTPPSVLTATAGLTKAWCGANSRTGGTAVSRASFKGCNREITTRVSCQFAGTPKGACDGLKFLARGHTDGILRLKSHAKVPSFRFPLTGTYFQNQQAVANADGSVEISRFGNGELLKWQRKTKAQVGGEDSADCKFTEPKIDCDVTLKASASPSGKLGCEASTGLSCSFKPMEFVAGLFGAEAVADSEVSGRLNPLGGEVELNSADWLVNTGNLRVKLSHDARSQRSGPPYTAEADSRGYARARIVFDALEFADDDANPTPITVLKEFVGRKQVSLICGACFGKDCKKEKPPAAEPPEVSLEPFECYQDADCDDGIACTVDRCNQDVCGCTNEPDDKLCETSGECYDATCDKTAGCTEAIVAGRACDDGSPCTIYDKCQEGFFGPGGCFGTSKLQVPVAEGGCARDGLGACVSVSCHEMSGKCVSDTASWDGETCDDGDPETQGERCRDGECKTCFCDEGYEVNEHEWYCDTEYDQSGRCLWDDENPGTCKWVWDPCAEAGSCVNKAGCARCPEDPEAATIPACQPDCIADSDCSDGDACNGEETCNTDTGTCALVTPPTCDDDDDCTVDWCDPIAGCQHTAVPGCGECSESDPSCGDPCTADPSLCPDPDPCATDPSQCPNPDPCATDPSQCPDPDPCATDPSQCPDPDPCVAKTEACEARYDSWNFPVVDDGTGGCPPGACISSLEAFCAGETTGSSADVMGGVGVTVCTAEAPCELTNGVVFGGTPGRCPCPCEPLSDEP